MEARLYAEDPARNFQPSAGTVTNAHYPAPDVARVDAWVETGSEVATNYDPLLGKIITHAADRDAAFDALAEALGQTRIDGIETNLGMLRAVTGLDVVRAAGHSTGTLDTVGDPEPRITVERPGLQTSVQDWPGRTGLWQVGVPPSGPMDDLSFRLGNTALGNAEGAPGLEFTMTGPALRVHARHHGLRHRRRRCRDGRRLRRADLGTRRQSPAAGVLDIGSADGAGLRGYVLFQGGLDIPPYLGSASTFTLGQFGGHGGRVLRAGDVLRAAADERTAGTGPGPVPVASRPALTTDWNLMVVEGPARRP